MPDRMRNWNGAGMAACLNGSGGVLYATGRLTLAGRQAEKKALDKHCDTLLSKLMKIFHNSDKRIVSGRRERVGKRRVGGRKRDNEQRIKHAARVRNKKVTNKHHMPAKMSTMQRGSHTHTQLIRAVTRGPGKDLACRLSAAQAAAGNAAG